MKKRCVLVGFLSLSLGLLSAQNTVVNDALIRETVRKKSKELEKEMQLSPSQKTSVLEASEKRSKVLEDALKEAKNPLLIAEQQYQADKDYDKQLSKTLNTQQYDYYLMSTQLYVAAAQAKKELGKVIPERTSGNLKTCYSQSFDYFLDQALIRVKYAGDEDKIQAELTKTRAHKPAILQLSQAERRIEKIETIVPLTAEQRSNLYKKFEVLLANKYAVEKMPSGKEKTLKQKEIEDNCNEAMYTVLSEEQSKKYIISNKLSSSKNQAMRALEEAAADNPDMDVMRYYDEVLNYFNEKNYFLTRYENDPVTRKEKYREWVKREPYILGMKEINNQAKQRAKQVYDLVGVSDTEKIQVLALAKECEIKLSETRKASGDDPIKKKKLQDPVKDVYQTALLKILGESRSEAYLGNEVLSDAQSFTNEYKKVLKEKGRYSDEKIAALSEEMSTYVLKEHILTQRYKYNPEKKEKELAKMKTQIPASVKYARSLRSKTKSAYQGTYQW